MDTPDNLLRPMLRTLLAERFRFAAHTEMREVPVYALVVDRSDGRLGPNLVASTQCNEALGPGTGDAALKLESTRGAVEMLVIDSVDRPAPN